jgi:hypothetical protein
MSCQIFGNQIFGKDSQILVGIWQKKLFLGWFWFVCEKDFLNLGKIVGEEKNSPKSTLKSRVSFVVVFMAFFWQKTKEKLFFPLKY